jgi:glyoxylase-like metal-dependent hydrolase (beta-lactamase superfamily II)
MEKVEPILHSLGHDISLIDLMEGNTPGRTGSYIIQAEKVAMIETGTSLSIPYILAGLDRLKIQPEKVDYIIVTHIHLDHSGGLGSLLPYLPNATVVVHRRGARHLVNPDKLIKGARAVYGEALESLFGQIDPVPEERILIRDEEETLDLGKGRTLTFYDTPGHARHHFSIYDSVTRGIFTGDTVGVRYGPEFTGADFEIIFPSTSPSEFDKQAVFESIDKLKKLNPSKIFHGHFGVTEPASVAFERTKGTIDAFDDLARSCFTANNQPAILEKKLREYMTADLVRHGHDANVARFFDVDIPINAKGLLYSLEKAAQKK